MTLEHIARALAEQGIESLALTKAQIAQLAKDWQRQERAIARLLRQVGDEGKCRGSDCGKPIVWIKTRLGKPQPLDPNGEPHHATCSDVRKFR